MNRRQFLKSVMVGAGAATVPMAVVARPETPEILGTYIPDPAALSRKPRMLLVSTPRTPPNWIMDLYFKHFEELEKQR